MDEPIQTFGVKIPPLLIILKDHVAPDVTDWLRKNTTTQFQHTDSDGCLHKLPAFGFTQRSDNKLEVRLWSADDAKNTADFLMRRSKETVLFVMSDVAGPSKKIQVRYVVGRSSGIFVNHRHESGLNTIWGEACAASISSGQRDLHCTLFSGWRHQSVAYCASLYALTSFLLDHLDDHPIRGQIPNYFLTTVYDPDDFSLPDSLKEHFDNAAGEGCWSIKTDEYVAESETDIEPPACSFLVTIDLTSCGERLTAAHTYLRLCGAREHFSITNKQ